MRKWAVAGLALWIGCIAPGWAQEAPEQFAKRIAKTKGVKADVNRRQTGALGSVAIGLTPELAQDKDKVSPVLDEIGKYAAAGKLKVHVVAPSAETVAAFSEQLKGIGVAEVATRVMADFASIKTVRVFLSPMEEQ